MNEVWTLLFIVAVVIGTIICLAPFLGIRLRFWQKPDREIFRGYLEDFHRYTQPGPRKSIFGYYKSVDVTDLKFRGRDEIFVFQERVANLESALHREIRLMETGRGKHCFEFVEE